MDMFIKVFYILIPLCIALFLYTRQAVKATTDANFFRFQRTYIIAYVMAMAADWLQGPHVYVLYDSYGMNKHDIEILFVAGFGSSMVFGTFVGSIADKYGRKSNCILYCIFYGGACITKFFPYFSVLMIGRLLGGIATSILYSAFESWLVYEHNKRGFDQSLLGSIFSNAVLSNSMVAIFSGIVAQVAADTFGYPAPFGMSLVVLIILSVVIMVMWTENYGDQTANIRESFTKALATIKSDPKILCLGMIQSLFEGSMYVFVLEWTPSLTPDPSTESTDKLPHGHIFAAFMVTVMMGSSLFKLMSKWTSIESFMRLVLFVAALSLMTPIIFKGNQLIVFIGFLVFETCVGIFWPSLGTMRGKYVPEATRATTMNIFRVPLNLLVVVILLQNLDRNIIFMCCVCFLLFATCFQHWLYVLYTNLPKALLIQTPPTKDEADAIQVKAKQGLSPIIEDTVTL